MTKGTKQKSQCVVPSAFPICGTPPTGILPVLSGILKWFLHWGGLAFLIALCLFGWTLQGGQYGIYTCLAGVALVFATLGYVAVIARTESQILSIQERDRFQSMIRQGVVSACQSSQKEIDELRKEMGEVQEAASMANSTTLEACQSRIRSLDEKIEHEKKSLLQMETELSRKAYQHFLRKLTTQDEETLLETWTHNLGVSSSIRPIRYLQQRFSAIEDQCQGRMAGHVQDVILRTLVCRSIKKEKINLLEIGTLFGINAIYLYDILSCHFDSVNLTLIDPLEGFYGKGELDWGTGLPVSKQILEKNFERMLIPPEKWNLIQAYSADDEAVTKASVNKYDFIFIDGDHEFEGVKKDFELYSGLVADGGFIVFDDYHNERWPDVTKVVDQIVTPSDQFEMVGFEWETVILRKR